MSLCSDGCECEYNHSNFKWATCLNMSRRYNRPSHISFIKLFFMNLYDLLNSTKPKRQSNLTWFTGSRGLYIPYFGLVSHMAVLFFLFYIISPLFSLGLLLRHCKVAIPPAFVSFRRHGYCKTNRNRSQFRNLALTKFNNQLNSGPTLS